MFIPCPFEHQSSPLIWRINRIEYLSVTLPPLFISSANGLFVDVVHQCLDQTSFQCVDTSSNGLRGQESSIGTLTVPKFQRDSTGM